MRLPLTPVAGRVLSPITAVHGRFSHSRPVPTVALVGLEFLHFLGFDFKLSLARLRPSISPWSGSMTGLAIVGPRLVPPT